MTDLPVAKKRGRPAAFDYDVALEQAMQTFWRYGYEGTSMSALMAAMQMNKASMYAAFGSKEALFQKAVARYTSGPASFVAEALQQPTAYAVVKSLLETAATRLSGQRCGCLVIQGALSCSQDAEAMQQWLAGLRLDIEQHLFERFERAKNEGDLPAEADARVLAKLVTTVHQGISVQATSGATAPALLEMVALVLTHFRA